MEISNGSDPSCSCWGDRGRDSSDDEALEIDSEEGRQEGIDRDEGSAQQNHKEAGGSEAVASAIASRPKPAVLPRAAGERSLKVVPDESAQVEHML
jgi:hypothetical protein